MHQEKETGEYHTFHRLNKEKTQGQNGERTIGPQLGLHYSGITLYIMHAPMKHLLSVSEEKKTSPDFETTLKKKVFLCETINMRSLARPPKPFLFL